jgi:splicing factor 3B subunit 2
LCCIVFQEEPVDRSKHWGDLEEEGEEEEEEEDEDEPMEDDEMEEGIQSVETMSRCYDNSLMTCLCSLS